MGTMEFDRTIGFFFNRQLTYARKGKGESVVAAVLRKVSSKTAKQVTMWYRECRDGHDVYVAKWFDADADVFRETEVVI